MDGGVASDGGVTDGGGPLDGGTREDGGSPAGAVCRAAADCSTPGGCLGGHCCATPCVAGPCGAAACDSAGGCLYPGAATSCPGSCAGAAIVGACDGSGGCTGIVQDCAPYACSLQAGAPACSASCSASSECDATEGAYCDGGSCQCVPASPAYVDESVGVDGPCCGGASNPCRTIGHLVGAVLAGPVCAKTSAAPTIELRKSGAVASGDWSSDPPGVGIALGLGVTLHAPGVQFSNSGSDLDPSFPGVPHTFSVVDYCGDGGFASATIEGDPGNPIGIGYGSGGETPKNEGLIVAGQLTLRSARVAADVGVDVQSGGLAVFGPRLVEIGGFALDGGPDGGALGGQVGIACAGGTVQANPGASLRISHQSTEDLLAEDDVAGNGCDATLLSGGVVLGEDLDGGQCAVVPQPDGVGIVAMEHSTVTFSGVARCMFQDGVRLEHGVYQGGGWLYRPLVTLSGASLYLNGCGGVDLQGGIVTATNTLFSSNHYGVLGQAEGYNPLVPLIDLSGGGNSVVCNSELVAGACYGNGVAGIGVWNAIPYDITASEINASGVAWDRSPPPFYECTASLSSCCLGVGCDPDGGAPPPDGAAVVSSANNVIDVGTPSMAVGCGF